MHRFTQWQHQKHTSKGRLAALAAGALIFPLGIPLLLIFVFPQVDEALGFGSFFHGWVNYLIGIPLVVIGAALAFWTIAAQMRLASGTPLPMLPTQKLLVVGPFKYCRNPMTLGTIVAYAGIAILVGSYTSLVVVILLAAVLIVYIKTIEEKELGLRFGDEYLEYKKNTPFMLPIRWLKTSPVSENNEAT